MQLIHMCIYVSSIQYFMQFSVSWYPDITVVQNKKNKKRRIWDQLGLQKTWIVCGMFQTIGDVSPFISILQQNIHNAFILSSLSKAMDCENVSQRSKKPHQNIKERESVGWRCESELTLKTPIFHLGKWPRAGMHCMPLRNVLQVKTDSEKILNNSLVLDMSWRSVNK